MNDDVVISLADSSWEILELSSSDVSDFGLAKVAEMCKSLRAVDIRYENLKLLFEINYQDSSYAANATKLLPSVYLKLCRTAIHLRR